MSDSHAVLYRARDRVEAFLLSHALKEAGINVGLVGGNVMDETAESARTELWVLREDIDRGRQVIEEHQTQRFDSQA